MRILGLCLADIHNPTSGAAHTASELFASLSKNHDLISYDVSVKGFKEYLNILYAISKEGKKWLQYYYKNNWVFAERSKIAHSVTSQLADSIDLVFQMYGLFAPFVGTPLKPYVVYTDYTMRLGVLQPFYKDVPFAHRLREKERWYSRERQLYQTAFRVFTCSELARNSVIEHYGADPDRVVTVGIGVTIEPIPESRDRSYSNRQIIFIGNRRTGVKGLPTLLRAFTLVRQEIKDAELVVVGLGRGRIEQEGVVDMGFVQDRRLIDQLLESASLFVMPSLIDAFGRVFIEAMMKKLPCVGTRVGGIPEVIVDGETGRLVHPQDPEYLANVIIELLEDEKTLQSMGEKGYRRAKDFFTWDKVTARIEEHLQSIV